MQARTFTILAALAPLFLSAPLMADDRTHAPCINAHQHHQHARIEHGMRSGQLTRSETKALAQSQKSLRHQERSYRSDGILTISERKDMHHDQHVASRSIYNEKHDGDVQARIRQ